MDVNGIAEMSMALSQYNVKEAIGISVLKKAMDNTEVIGQQVMEMVETVSTEGIDIRL